MMDEGNEMTEPMPGEDVAEACADALLAASAQALVLQHQREVSILEARNLAVAMVDRVIERTLQEGPRPR